MATPRAGDLRSKLGFFSRQDGGDVFGNTKAGYAADPDFSVSAQVVPKLGGEQVLASRLAGTNLVNVIVRASSQTKQVKVDWMAKDMRTGEIFNIRSIIDPFQGASERGRWIEILCEKGVAVGAASA